MEVRFWAATDVGRTRDHNEDNFLVDKKLNLFIVADGMGGHAAGEVASSVAVREVRRVISDHRTIIESFTGEPTAPGRKALLRLVGSAIEQACATVFGLAQENAERRGMGTTLSLMMVCGAEAFIGHVLSLKPATSKGIFILNASLTTTMGPGISLQVNS